MRLSLPKRRWQRILILLFAAMIGLHFARISYGIIRWKSYIWLPSYVTSSNSDRPVADADKHLVFIMADHYEPGKGERGVRIHEDWLAHFKPIADRHRDTSGNKFRYSWFYPYDHKNEKVLASLSRAAYEGYGEVELHWHHPPATSETFPGMLEEALAWFQNYGAMVSPSPDARTRFAFIHGNWALDNSSPLCGVDREIDILFQHGCYADFTFSTIGTDCQPKKTNSIYYATDTPQSKSYDDGVDVEVGQAIEDRLMIFEGPLTMDWKGGIEYGAVESYSLPSPKRVHRWIDANVHVKGRPEWIFVKVYSHGCQSADAIVKKHLDGMLDTLEAICRERGITLHYMTAREAFNVVKAAEAGMTGDPEEYRDYEIPKPRNLVEIVETAH
jgi:hypothetical protein